MNLAEKIRKAREQVVEAGGYRFTVRRPTDVEMMDMHGTGSVARMFQFVIGWEGVNEIDVVPGGDPVPLKFSEAVRDEWLADRMDIMVVLVDILTKAYKAHAEQLEAAAKN